MMHNGTPIAPQRTSLQVNPRAFACVCRFGLMCPRIRGHRILLRPAHEQDHRLTTDGAPPQAEHGHGALTKQP